MSSILKALQKLERDKETRKTREPDISSAIMMSGVRKKEQARWLIPVLVLAVAVISVLTTFSLMGGFSGKMTALPHAQQPAQPRQQAVLNPPPDQTASPAPQTILLNPAQAPTPAPLIRRRPAVVPSLPVPKASALPPDSAETEPAPPVEAVQQQLPAPAAEKTVSRPGLEINGIAWQQDSASRIAVVNGRSVSEGSSVDGARVEQIFPDRVRFSHSGKTFDVTLEHEGRQ